MLEVGLGQSEIGDGVGEVGLGHVLEHPLAAPGDVGDGEAVDHGSGAGKIAGSARRAVSGAAMRGRRSR